MIETRMYLTVLCSRWVHCQCVTLNYPFFCKCLIIKSSKKWKDKYKELKKESKAKDTELKKKTSFESEHDGGIVRLAFTPVKGHSFWAEVIALAVCMYIRMGCKRLHVCVNP